jgi:hypothetical protein
MKLGLMQPYLFPYIGYFQLIKAVDLFVIYDDVQYIKNGWINRNRILLNGEPKYITLAVRRDESHVCQINQRYLSHDFKDQQAGIMRQIEAAYRSAPNFIGTMELIRMCLQCEDTNLAHFVSQTISLCCEHLEIRTPLRTASSIEGNTSLRGQDKVIWVNKTLGADQYVNAIGGKEIYSKQEFALNGIRLAFLRSHDIEYTQFDRPFVPWLSIIDVLMFNSRDCIQYFLTKFTLE